MDVMAAKNAYDRKKNRCNYRKYDYVRKKKLQNG